MTNDIKRIRYVVVGAGFWGAVMAERIASQLGQRVLLIDRRPHIGGNSHSEVHRKSNIEVHCYGSHIFHTADEGVWSYIAQFTSFNHYRHRVLAVYKGHQYFLPINLKTINDFFGKDFSPAQAEAFMRRKTAGTRSMDMAHLEGKAVAGVGRQLYNAFFKGYTLKQWGEDPRRLPAGIIARLPVRFDHNPDYFSDPYQGIPRDGYQALFKKMLQHSRIILRLNTDFAQLKPGLDPSARIFYSGPIDQFFGYSRGMLGWRTIDLEEEVLPVKDFQGTAVVNYPDGKVPYTRIHEFKHYHPERGYDRIPRTVIFREYPRNARRDEVPCYPMNRQEDEKRLKEYQAMARALPNVTFGGRLGEYKYYNMDRTIRAALDVFAALKKEGRNARI